MPVIETLKKIKRMVHRAAEIYDEDKHRRAQYPDFEPPRREVRNALLPTATRATLAMAV